MGLNRLRGISLAGALVLLCAAPAFGGDFIARWKVGEWETWVFPPETATDGISYAVERVREGAPDHNSFSLKSMAPECGRYAIEMHLYNTPKREFTLTGEKGHFAVGTFDVPFTYDLWSFGYGFYRVEIHPADDAKLLDQMRNAPIMAAHFPKVGIIREIRLNGLPAALDRAGKDCRTRKR